MFGFTAVGQVGASLNVGFAMATRIVLMATTNTLKPVARQTSILLLPIHWNLVKRILAPIFASQVKNLQAPLRHQPSGDQTECLLDRRSPVTAVVSFTYFL